MSSRRSESRFALAAPGEGTLRILREVTLHRGHDGELLAISLAPVAAGETLLLNVSGGELEMRLQVRVIESRPLVVEGAVRHRLRLLVTQGADDYTGECESADLELGGGVEPIV